jgi:hypothetical protein
VRFETMKILIILLWTFGVSAIIWPPPQPSDETDQPKKIELTTRPFFRNEDQYAKVGNLPLESAWNGTDLQVQKANPLIEGEVLLMCGSVDWNSASRDSTTKFVSVLGGKSGIAVALLRFCFSLPLTKTAS